MRIAAEAMSSIVDVLMYGVDVDRLVPFVCINVHLFAK